MCDGARRTPFTTFNLCYKGAVTGMTGSQATRSGEHVKMEPQKNASVQERRADLALVLRGAATRPSGAPDTAAGVDASPRSVDLISWKPPRPRVASVHVCGTRADAEDAWLPSLLISDEKRSFSQSFINNCLFSARLSAVLKSKNGRSAIFFSPVNTTTHECTHALNTNLRTLTHAHTHAHTVS